MRNVVAVRDAVAVELSVRVVDRVLLGAVEDGVDHHDPSRPVSHEGEADVGQGQGRQEGLAMLLCLRGNAQGQESKLLGLEDLPSPPQRQPLVPHVDRVLLTRSSTACDHPRPRICPPKALFSYLPLLACLSQNFLSLSAFAFQSKLF